MMHIRHFRNRSGKRKTIKKGIAAVQEEEFEETVINFFESTNMAGIRGQKLNIFPLSFYSGVRSGQLRYESNLLHTEVA